MSEDTKMTLSIKNTLVALTLIAVTTMPLQAVGASGDSAKKQIRNEVGIMLNILRASLKQKSSNNNIRLHADSVFYLAEQGVVFEIDGGRHGGNFFGFDLQGLINNIPMAPLAPGSSAENHFIDTSEIEAMVEKFIQHDDDYDHDMRDNLRDLSEEKRELAWEKREYERNMRDLEFEKRNADGERKKELEKELAKLDKVFIKVQQKAQELEAYRSELEAEHKKEMAIRSAAKKKLYTEALAVFEDTVAEMLCSYGAGLKSLPIGENITFLLTDFIQAEDDSVINTHDKVYVFKHKDVKSCVTGGINKEQLLTSVNTYLF
ncbi:hypothetical protein [Paraglaciecola marina]|uniref:hypothetical protein n=1 Tax=Paraglaciecola marina TaxID=2500157 RepID=UPI001EF11FBB|nr:hypothetical protein [Paraglaciecola marina]